MCHAGGQGRDTWLEGLVSDWIVALASGGDRVALVVVGGHQAEWGRTVHRRPRTVIVAPTSETTEKVHDAVSPDISVVAVSRQKIGSLVTKKTLKENNDNLVYKTPSGVHISEN